MYILHKTNHIKMDIFASSVGCIVFAKKGRSEIQKQDPTRKKILIEEEYSMDKRFLIEEVIFNGSPPRCHLYQSQQSFRHGLVILTQTRLSLGNHGVFRSPEPEMGDRA